MRRSFAGAAPVLVIAAASLAVADRRQFEPSKVYSVRVSKRPSEGPADARVTIVMVRDYADPFSAGSRDHLAELRKQYGSDLRIVYRNFVVHPQKATAAALASCAANKQGKFAQLDALLWDEGFKNRKFDESSCWQDAAGCTFIPGWAKQVGLDVTKLYADMTACERPLHEEMLELQDLGVEATPTFFINGRAVVGKNLDQLDAVVREELAKAKQSKVEPASYYQKVVVEQGELHGKEVPYTPPPRPPTTPTTPTTGVQRPPRPEPDRAKTYAIQVDGYPSEGPADAKITLVFIRDYASPYAEKVRETLAALRKKYGNDLRIVHRDLVVHPQIATVAAVAACAAHKQGKFATFDALLWDEGYKKRQFDQHDTGKGSCWEDAAGCTNVDAFAKQAGLDVTKLHADMTKCASTVTTDGADLATFAVNATPSFFVNGRFLSGALPIENFSTLIDEELAKFDAAKVDRAKYYQTIVIGKGEKKL